MHQYNYLLWVVYLGLISCGTSPTTTEEHSSKDASIFIPSLMEKNAQALVEKPLINSTSIGLYYQGEHFIQHHGELEKGKGNSPSDQTIYEIGSLSKVITGTLVAKAVLENKLQAKEAINTYLPTPYPNLAYQDQPILLKHLLTHSSGLPNILPPELVPFLTSKFPEKEAPETINNIIKNYSQEQFLEDLHQVEITNPLGVEYSYSNTATELLAHVLEQVYQKDYESLLTEFLAEEIGMNQTKIVLEEGENQQLAVGYHMDHPTITTAMEKLPWGAGGNIKSTVPDLMKFIEYHLGDHPIAQTSHQILLPYEEEIGLAYFWEVHTPGNKWGTYYSHHGGVSRSQCYIFILPEYDLGAFIITNQSGVATADKLQATIDPIFEGIIAQHPTFTNGK